MPQHVGKYARVSWLQLEIRHDDCLVCPEFAEGLDHPFDVKLALESCLEFLKVLLVDFTARLVAALEPLCEFRIVA